MPDHEDGSAMGEVECTSVAGQAVGRPPSSRDEFQPRSRIVSLFVAAGFAALLIGCGGGNRAILLVQQSLWWGGAGTVGQAIKELEGMNGRAQWGSHRVDDEVQAVIMTLEKPGEKSLRIQWLVRPSNGQVRFYAAEEGGKPLSVIERVMSAGIRVLNEATRAMTEAGGGTRKR